ncbi:hypothetical protein GJ744_000142 [Endocarpon pusillum]|uniref:Uncharacterized protein n=1 Tax=Endocarpon pusillum TaxID=364733 RepID=A0A8H7AWW0_9EURO|nr:hypothetical protein GJ744_000142 [Endocarpon pusillum]
MKLLHYHRRPDDGPPSAPPQAHTASPPMRGDNYVLASLTYPTRGTHTSSPTLTNGLAAAATAAA